MNKYLVQALRDYRLRSEGQFGQVTESKLDITQDAADEIERLQRCLDEAAGPLVISFDGKNTTTGLCQGFSWKKVKELVEAYEKSTYQVVTFTATTQGFTAVWEAQT